MCDKKFIFIESCLFIALVGLITYNGRLDFTAPFELNISFVVSIIVNFMIGIALAWWSFGQGEKAERGDTNNIHKIMSLFSGDEKDDGEIMLSESALSTMHKIRPDVRERLQYLFEQLREQNIDNLRSHFMVKVSQKGRYMARLNKNIRVSFFKKGKKIFIFEIFSHR